jgi:recombination protein RecT
MTNSMVRRGDQRGIQRQAPGGAVASTGQVATIEALLKKHGAEIAMVLPEHVTPERLLRIALSEVRRNPRLGQCSAASLLSSIFTCAQLGLEPGGALGHAYLIPYRDECQFQIGYKGMIDLARRSGQIVSLSARAVYEADRFEYSYGLHEDLIHRPAAGARGELAYAYAVARLKDGGVQFEVMDRAELEEVRDGSQGYQTARKYNKTDTPWISSFEEMCRKTVIRRLFKYLPISIELAKAANLDEIADRGQRQESDLDHLLLTPEPPAALLAAVAPVATITPQQLQQLTAATGRQLTAVGQAAFLADACTASGVSKVTELPAESFTALMRSLGDAGARQRWDRGCCAATGDQILTDELIASLQAQDQAQGQLLEAPEAAEPEPAPEPARAAVRTTRQAAPAAAAAPQPEQQQPSASGDDAAVAAAQSELL